jgi:outer membrane lipoprotein-sorting protein
MAFLAAPASARDADQLVRAAIAAPRHVSYVAQIEETRWGTNQATAMLARVEHKAPDETRHTFLAPQSLYGEFIITHGRWSQQFDPKTGRVVRTQNPSTENTPSINIQIALLSANYRAIPGPDETIAGRAASTLSLVNRHTGERMMRLWVDAQTNLILGRETYHSDGSLATRMRFDEIRYTNDIPESLFSRAVPIGYQTIEGRRYANPSSDIRKAVLTAGFTPLSPKYLPDGFAIESADTSFVKDIKSLHLLYSDGVRNLSLFENNRDAAADFGTMKPSTVTINGYQVSYVKDGPTTLLAWRAHDLTFALVGDLDTKELLDIAKSVVP